MPIVTANGLSLAFDSFGDGSAGTCLLISGLGTQMIRWTEPFCHLLAADGFRVIRFDNRDAGLSTHLSDEPAPDFATLAADLREGRRPRVPYSLRDMARDAVGLLDALSIGCAHVLGRSMGGMIAQIMAADDPDRVASLTSIMSGTGNPALPGPAPDVWAMMTRPAPDPRTDEAAYLERGLAFARRIAGTGGPFDADGHRALLAEEARRAWDPAGTARQIAAIAVTGDLRPDLARIRTPALILHGTDDPLIPPASGQDSAASIPGARLVLIDGMGHDLPPWLDGRIAGEILRHARVARASARTA
ncbi:MAG: alpha/beta fold hydrolase [Telmatospirillum sp.]|nr:alpha/beta fold hydrolase [Telmatospirillum sp.]